MDQVVAALDETVDVETSIELVRVGERLLGVADSECIGPGTHRAAVAGAAVYAADRLTDGKSLTQADVIEAASTLKREDEVPVIFRHRDLVPTE